MSGNYSTTEVDTGYTWTDGSKIYKKTVTGNLSTGEKTLSHGISNLGTVIKIEGSAVRNDGKKQPLPAIVPQYLTQFSIGMYDITSSSITFYIGSNISSASIFLTVYYTKSN